MDKTTWISHAGGIEYEFCCCYTYLHCRLFPTGWHRCLGLLCQQLYYTEFILVSVPAHIEQCWIHDCEYHTRWMAMILAWSTHCKTHSYHNIQSHVMYLTYPPSLLSIQMLSTTMIFTPTVLIVQQWRLHFAQARYGPPIPCPTSVLLMDFWTRWTLAP